MTYENIETFIEEGKYNSSWNSEARNGKGAWNGRPERRFDWDLENLARSSGITNERALRWMQEQAHDRADSFMDRLKIFEELIEFSEMVKEK